MPTTTTSPFNHLTPYMVVVFEKNKGIQGQKEYKDLGVAKTQARASAVAMQNASKDFHIYVSDTSSDAQPDILLEIFTKGGRVGAAKPN